MASAPNVRAMLTGLVGKPYPASALARDVLVGLARNQGIIVAPRHARLAWAAYRAAPNRLLNRSIDPIRRQAAEARRQG